MSHNNQFQFHNLQNALAFGTCESRCGDAKPNLFIYLLVNNFCSNLHFD